VQPSIDVIEVGASNHFGHPTQTVLDRLSGDLVLRTDQGGDVRVTTDGSRIWVER
jgi:competence protein ComEC